VEKLKASLEALTAALSSECESESDSAGRQTWLRDAARRNQLVKELREFASDFSRLKLVMADIKHRPLADELISIFNLAGWQADLTVVPLETYIHKYHQSIEVRGYNRHFVDTVCAALTKSGLPNVRSSLEDLAIPRQNPKWNYAQQTVKITIGHSMS
jgi:hypothetical protein